MNVITLLASLLVGGGAGAVTAALVVKVKLDGAAARYGPPPGYPQGPGGPPFPQQPPPQQLFPQQQPPSQPFPQQQMPQPYPPQGPYSPR